MVRIITVEREYGSGGGVIAEKIAKRLGWRLWDQQLTDEIARRMGCHRSVVEEHEERRDPAFYRLMKSFMLGSFEGSVNAPQLRMVDTDYVRSVVEQILTEAAEAGNCVIVGRGSAYYLARRRDAFHVFIYAAYQDKIRRLRATGKSEQEAIKLVETVDEERAAFVKRYFNIVWPERHRFHLMINSRVGDEVAVDTVLDVMNKFAGHPVSTSA
jgi:cytidylate kinase